MDAMANVGRRFDGFGGGAAVSWTGKAFYAVRVWRGGGLSAVWSRGKCGDGVFVSAQSHAGDVFDGHGDGIAVRFDPCGGDSGVFVVVWGTIFAKNSAGAPENCRIGRTIEAIFGRKPQRRRVGRMRCGQPFEEFSGNFSIGAPWEITFAPWRALHSEWPARTRQHRRKRLPTYLQFPWRPEGAPRP